MLDIWREPFEELVHDHIRVDRRLQLNVRLPAQRLLPTALVSPEKQIVVTAGFGARHWPRAARRWGSPSA